MVLAGALFVTSSAAWQAVVGAAAYGMAASIYLSIPNLYGAEFCALNRLGAALSRVLLVPLLRTSGPGQMFSVIACVVLAGTVVACLSPQGRQRLGLR